MKTNHKLLIVLVVLTLIVLTLIVGSLAFAGKPATARTGHTQPALTYSAASVAWLEMAANPLAGQIARRDPGFSEQGTVAWNS